MIEHSTTTTAPTPAECTPSQTEATTPSSPLSAAQPITSKEQTSASRALSTTKASNMEAARDIPLTFKSLIELNEKELTEKLTQYFNPEEKGNKKAVKQFKKELNADLNLKRGFEGVDKKTQQDFRAVLKKLKVKSPEIDLETNKPTKAFNPKLIERTAEEIAIHFLLETAADKAAQTAANKQAEHAAAVTPPTLEGAPEANPLSNYTKHKVSGQDHKCWMRSLWFIILGSLTKTELANKLIDNSPLDMDGFNSAYAAAQQSIIESLNDGSGSFKFNPETEETLMQWSLSLLPEEDQTKLKQPLSMADNEQMGKIAEKLGLSFTFGVDINHLQPQGMGATDNPRVSPQEASEQNKPIIIGGRIRIEGGAGHDHFDLLLPPEKQKVVENFLAKANP